MFHINPIRSFQSSYIPKNPCSKENVDSCNQLLFKHSIFMMSHSIACFSLFYDSHEEVNFTPYLNGIEFKTVYMYVFKKWMRWWGGGYKVSQCAMNHKKILASVNIKNILLDSRVLKTRFSSSLFAHKLPFLWLWNNNSHKKYVLYFIFYIFFIQFNCTRECLLCFWVRLWVL